MLSILFLQMIFSLATKGLTKWLHHHLCDCLPKLDFLKGSAYPGGILWREFFSFILVYFLVLSTDTMIKETYRHKSLLGADGSRGLVSMALVTGSMAIGRWV